MSLINEALKKAQKQRTHEPLTAIPVSAPAGAPPPRVAKRKEPMPAQTLVLIGTLCLALVVALGVGAWFVFKESSTQIAASHNHKKATAATHPAGASDGAVTATTAPSSASSAQAAATAPGVSSPLASTTPTGSASSPAAATAAHPNPTPAGAATVEGSALTTAAHTATPATTTPSPATPAAAISTPQSSVADATTSPAPAPTEIIHITAADLKRAIPPNPQALAVVDTFKVSGIRASASDPKVLMNDRVFRLNDIVERTYGLRLTEVHADRLLFVDEAGAVYTKTF